MKLTKILFVLAMIVSLTAVGCIGDDSGGGSEGNGEMQGDCAYKDAERTPQGNPRPAAKPAPQPMELTVSMSGTGTFPQLSGACTGTGNFSGSMHDETTVDSNGGYLHVLNFGEGQFSTSLGCEIPELQLSQVLTFKVVAKLQNTQQNCKTYCDSQLRASCESDANSACGTSSAGSTCRANYRSSCEASGSTSCQTHCSGSTTRRITAETELSATAIAELNARRAGLNTLGEFKLDLTFDKVTE